MCGRFTQSVSLQDVIDKYSLRVHDLDEELAEGSGAEVGPLANMNLAPTEATVIVRAGESGRIASIARFGHVVAFSRQPLPKLLINARSETVLAKPTYSRAAQGRRAVVPVNGYFEWKKEAGSKTPFFIHPMNEPIASLAALWFAPDDVNQQENFVILTQSASSGVQEIHDRMPVMIPNAMLDAWLDPKMTEKKLVAEMVSAAAAETASRDMESYPVTKAVSRADFKSSRAIEPLR